MTSISEDTLGVVRSHLYKCDFQGDTVWTREYISTTDFLSANSLISHPDGGFVLLGIVKEQGTNESDIFILRADTAGNELWRDYYGLPGKSEYVNPTFVHISGEEYFIGAGEIVPVFGNPDLAYYVKVFLLKRKNDGSFWKKDLSRPLQSEHTPLGIIRTSDGNFVYGSFTNDASVPYSTSAKGMMVKINEAGDELWKNEIGDFGNANALSLVAEKPDGTLLFAGRKTTGLPLGNELAWVVHANAGGAVLSQTTFQWPGFGTALYHNLRDITLLPDGRLAGCGEIVADKQRIWFFVSDQNGCFDQFCTYLGEAVPETPQGFSVYPNPATDWLYVYNPYTGLPLNAKLLNLSGQIFSSNMQLHGETTNAIAVSELTVGIYFLQITLPDGKVVTEKIIKQ